MNREIKFRGWDDSIKCMFTSDSVGISNFFSHANRWKYIIQQYTGLKDSKGVDIYEGDLIQYNQNSSYDGMSFEVKWSEDSLGYIFQSKTGEVLTNEWTPNGNRFKLIEVVGNVHEN